MTRQNLIQAIYDNTDSWSCKTPCPHIMEEENPSDVCWNCAEKQLAEYEQQIKADTIDEVRKICGTENPSYTKCAYCLFATFKDNFDTTICKIEQLKENK